ncbi:MAG: endolytic transglycosylase MltG [Selenomonadaceae bacterium]|nr:endolytic transglycosylase MltG [Selenomonadaceae bacterium]
MKEPDDKKISTDNDDEIKIPSRRANKKSFKDSVLEKFRESSKDLKAEISWKYVASVAGAVFFCIVVIGAVLIFVDPSVAHINKPTQTETETSNVGEEKRINVKIREGLSTAEIAERLAEKGVIDSTLKFRLLARVYGYDDKLRPGSYTFTLGMSNEEVFAKLLTGEKKLVHFTIPEGFGIKEIAARLQSLDLADKDDFIKAATDFVPYDYMKKHKDVFYSAEGFLFPDTYTVESDVEIIEILNLMAKNFDKKLTLEMRSQAAKMDLSIYDLITLASLVEREVRFPEDRPIVAQVFFKRLKLNMPLQTDATLQYLMDTPKEDLSIEDTQIDSPYNTYQHLGLPPGPIANPGLASIEAVLHPADTDYLYFVADRKGHNHYANTYEEHLNLVNKYR